MSWWNQERTDQLKSDWAEGYTAEEIKGRIPGATRNSVMGKINRLKLHNRKQGVAGNDARVRVTKASVRRASKRKSRFKERKPTPRDSAEQHLACTEATNLPPDESPCAVTFKELAFHHCRWPIDGTDLLMMYCGAQKLEGVAYCSRHFLIGTQRPEKRRAVA
jgi:hypothetical protein